MNPLEPGDHMGVHEIDFGTITVWEIVVSAYRARMN